MRMNRDLSVETIYLGVPIYPSYSQAEPTLESLYRVRANLAIHLRRGHGMTSKLTVSILSSTATTPSLPACTDDLNLSLNSYFASNTQYLGTSSLFRRDQPADAREYWIKCPVRSAAVHAPVSCCLRACDKV